MAHEWSVAFQCVLLTPAAICGVAWTLGIWANRCPRLRTWDRVCATWPAWPMIGLFAAALQWGGWLLLYPRPLPPLLAGRSWMNAVFVMIACGEMLLTLVFLARLCNLLACRRGIRRGRLPTGDRPVRFSPRDTVPPWIVIDVPRWRPGRPGVRCER